MGNLMGIKIDWSVADPESTKTELKKALDDLCSAETQKRFDEILDNFGEDYIKNFDPAPINDALHYLRKAVGANDMYGGLFTRGISCQDCCSEGGINTVKQMANYLDTYLEYVLAYLVEDVEKNSNILREFTRCTEHSPDKEIFVSQYAEKLKCIDDIEELLLKMGVINVNHIPNKIGLIELKSRVDLYLTKFAQSNII